jgi:PhoPQ-activated pathogenicity-related protein
MPKYILNSTGDEFFVPDSSQFYFKDLVGPKYLRYVPNTSHALNNDAITGAVLFEKVLAQGVPLPQFNWVISPDGTSITLNTVDTPAIVKLWQATNLQSRDFRLETFGANWTSTILSPQSLGQYIATLTAPPTGATAFMIELTYNMGGAPLVFTTDVSVIQIPEPAGIVLLLVALTIGVFRRGRNGCR